MYLEKHQIEVTTPRFSSLYYKSSSKYMLNQIAEMLGMLKKNHYCRSYKNLFVAIYRADYIYYV